MSREPEKFKIDPSFRFFGDRFIMIGNVCYEKSTPWLNSWVSAVSRCDQKNKLKKGFERYAGRGITCRLSKFDIEDLWFRDKAWTMKKPSIDRINPHDDYYYENCRFIEQVENSRRVHDKTF